MPTPINSFLEIVFSSGEWCQLSYPVLRASSSQEAVMMMHLMNKSRLFRASEKDGWFYCTVRGVQLETGMSDDSQRRTINKLKKRGWVETMQRGLPAKRYFHLNMQKMVLDSTGIDLEAPELDTQEPLELDTQEPPEHSLYKGEVFKGKGDGLLTVTPPPKKTTPTKKEQWWRLHKDKWSRTDRELAKLFYGVMKKHTTDLYYSKQMTRDVYKENIWRVRSKRMVNRKKIEEVLQWYQDNYGKPYVPELKHLYDFEKKFNSLQMAMQRDGWNEQKLSSKDEYFEKQREQDRRDEAETEFEHHYYTAYPMHDHLQPKESNEICKQLGLPPRYRSEGMNTWSRID